MELRLSLLFLAVLLLSSFASSATVSGEVYEWYSLELLPDVIIDVNTIPHQTIVSKDGSYSLELSPGDYLLRAEYFEENALVYETEEEISIVEEGTYSLDLLMFPSLEDDFLWDENLIGPEIELGGEGDDGEQDDYLLTILIAVAGIVIIGAMGAFYFTRLQRKTSPEDKPEILKGGKTDAALEDEMDSALNEVIGILERYGGRMTQKELRDKVSFGEAKTSLVVAELEHMGKIKKFKKGRGNILVLKSE
ncbi:MAG: hypothetical protein ABID38_07215 [Candidatus Diapherotrites archaeon]